MSVATLLRNKVAMSSVAVAVVAGVAMPGIADAATPHASNYYSMAGTWSVAVVEHSTGGPFNRSGTFTYYTDGTGTLTTSAGLTGPLNWGQSADQVQFSFQHNLPNGGYADGTQNGYISADGYSYSTTGTTYTYDANGYQTDAFQADFTGSWQY